MQCESGIQTGCSKDIFSLFIVSGPSVGNVRMARGQLRCWIGTGIICLGP